MKTTKDNQTKTFSAAKKKKATSKLIKRINYSKTRNILLTNPSLLYGIFA
ncbi:MAG: hypothetical protein HY063_13925 [Bacteroidetes bacterium]|nr:hypothetical protein [Bacteroidota bacterium]